MNQVLDAEALSNIVEDGLPASPIRPDKRKRSRPVEHSVSDCASEGFEQNVQPLRRDVDSSNEHEAHRAVLSTFGVLLTFARASATAGLGPCGTQYCQAPGTTVEMSADSAGLGHENASHVGRRVAPPPRYTASSAKPLALEQRGGTRLRAQDSRTVPKSRDPPIVRVELRVSMYNIRPLRTEGAEGRAVHNIESNSAASDRAHTAPN